MVFLNPSTDEVVALSNLLNLLRIPNLLTKFALNLRLIKAPTQFVVRVRQVRCIVKNPWIGHTLAYFLFRDLRDVP